MVSALPPVLELICPVQHYAWGKGRDGLVARLSSYQGNEPCAELWMGTHPSGPAIIKNTGQSLEAVIGTRLPFLFKVLSVRTALSIQAHPDKALAEELHRVNPKAYPDDNHKPEMTVAVSEFEALCGFRPMDEIEACWREIPTLQELAECDGDLRSLFLQVMRADEQVVRAVGKEITRCANNSDVLGLFKRLWSQYPDDVGCFCVFLLNYIRLEPGQAMFLAANEPHAYISGECVECMAASDNVVRAGLTPKPRDVDVLVKMLTYRQYNPKELIIGPQTVDDIRQYRVPVTEFCVNCLTIANEHQVRGIRSEKHSIVIVTEGKGLIEGIQYQPGSIFYLSPQSNARVDAKEKTVMYQATEP